MDERLSKLKRQMNKLVNTVADELGLDENKVKLNHSNQQGYHFRVSRKDEKALRAAHGFTSLEARKDGVRFTNSEASHDAARPLPCLAASTESLPLTRRPHAPPFRPPQMKKLSSAYLDVSREYDETQAVVVAKALEVTQTYCELLERASGIIADLDVLCAFAHSAATASTPYVRPKYVPFASPSNPFLSLCLSS